MGNNLLLLAASILALVADYLDKVHGDRANVPAHEFETLAYSHYKLGKLVKKIGEANKYNVPDFEAQEKKGG